MANGSMIRSRDLEMKWHSPQALADRADNGFRFVVRSTARIVCNLPSGMGHGLSKLGRVVLCRKKATRPAEPTEAAPPQRLASVETPVATPADTQPSSGGTPCQDIARAAELAQQNCPLIPPVDKPRHEETIAKAVAVAKKWATAKRRAPKQKTSDKETQCTAANIDALLSEHIPKDKVQATRLRNALDNLINGSETARKSALEALVELGEDAGPSLVACSRVASPEVVELALEGLRQLGWHCLVSSISAVLESPSIEMRIIALRAAGQLVDDRRRALLERGLRDPVSRVRRRTISYVSWQGSSWAVSEIMRLCDDVKEDVQWAAIEALMALKPTEASDHLRLMMPSLAPPYQRRATALLAQQEKLAEKPPAAKAPKKPRKRKASTSKAPKKVARVVAETEAPEEPVETDVTETEAAAEPVETDVTETEAPCESLDAEVAETADVSL